MLGWLPLLLHLRRWAPESGHPGAVCTDGGDRKTRGKKETTCIGGENNQAEGKEKNNLSSYNIKALLPLKEIKARVK